MKNQIDIGDLWSKWNQAQKENLRLRSALRVVREWLADGESIEHIRDFIREALGAK